MIALNIQLFEKDLFHIDLLELLFKFSFNIVFAFLIIRVLYYPSNKKKEFLFSYFLINILIFSMCALLRSVNLDTGFALGLFAVFGIIRYRTEAIPIKEMTYLFIIIGVAVINSLWNNKISISEILAVNTIIVICTFLIEKMWLLENESTKMITYERIDLIKPENHQELMTDLKARTGLNIHKFIIKDVDFLRDVAKIEIAYFNNEEQADFMDESIKS